MGTLAGAISMSGSYLKIQLVNRPAQNRKENIMNPSLTNNYVAYNVPDLLPYLIVSLELTIVRTVLLFIPFMTSDQHYIVNSIQMSRILNIYTGRTYCLRRPYGRVFFYIGKK